MTCDHTLLQSLPVRGKAIFAAAGLAGLYVAYAACCPLAQAWGRGFHRGPRRRREVALTFDDGPSECTPAVLDVLQYYDLRATFFVCGKNVERFPAIVREIAAAGHEIGNHTYSHPGLLLRSASEVRLELERTQNAVEEAAGARPRLFRPPYGVRAPCLRSIQEDLGLTTVLWTVIGNDWKLRREAIAERVLRRAAEGAIICLHDGHEVYHPADRRETVAALPEIVAGLRRRGFSFVTAGRMLDELNGRRAEQAALRPCSSSKADPSDPSLAFRALFNPARSRSKLQSEKLATRAD